MVAGYSAAAEALQAMGLTGVASAQEMPLSAGNGTHVVVLGAGITGLTCAYELEQAGFKVTLLEARERVGGLAWTIRSGDKIEMVGEETQVARFSEGMYLNAGAGRIPHLHKGILGYAEKFGVPMEVAVISNRSAYILDHGSKLRMRTAINDFRGRMSELLAKAINRGALDQELSAADKKALLPFLNYYGDLDEDYVFRGTQRSGFATSAGIETFATAPEPMPLATLLSNEQLPLTMFEDYPYMQAPMLQPVGGMDRIPVAFDRNLRDLAVRGAEVVRIRQSAKTVEVVYRDKSAATRSVVGDYLVSTIPFPVLAKIDANFARPVARAITAIHYDDANKVAFDAPRFWERNDHIHGGISYLDGETQMLWYPSDRLNSSYGVLVACYNGGATAARFQQRSVAEQIAMARASVERVHPGHGRDLTHGIAVNWKKIPFSLGPWPVYSSESIRQRHDANIDTPEFRLLLQPDGRIYFAGAPLSQLPGWQEGGVLSAQRQVANIAKRVAAQAPSARPMQSAARAAL